MIQQEAVRGAVDALGEIVLESGTVQPAHALVPQVFTGQEHDRPVACAFANAGIDLVLSYRNEAYRADAQAWFEENDRPLPRFATFVPRIKAQGEGGHVVNVASMAAYLSGPQAGIYVASKFAVRGLIECLRMNLAPYGIRENRALILTHPEFAEDFREIYEASLAALPDEEVPPGRLEIERLRREALRAANEGKRIGLDDLT